MRKRAGSVSAAALVVVTAALGIFPLADGLPRSLTAQTLSDGYSVSDGTSTATFLTSGAAEPNVTVCSADGCTTAFTEATTATVTCAVSGDAITTLSILEQATGRSYGLLDSALPSWSSFAYQNKGSSRDGQLDLSRLDGTLDASTLGSTRHFDGLAACEDMYDDMYSLVVAASIGNRLEGVWLSGNTLY